MMTYLVLLLVWQAPDYFGVSAELCRGNLCVPICSEPKDARAWVMSADEGCRYTIRCPRGVNFIHFDGFERENQ